MATHPPPDNEITKANNKHGKTSEMFRVNEKRAERKSLIEKIAKVNVGAGVILASTDFEWTLSRCILVLGKSPTVTLRDELLQPKTGLEGYKDIWKKEIVSPRIATLFDDRDWAVKNGLAPVNWSAIPTARELRNYLVHGIQSNVEEEIGRAIINLLERACDILCAFAQSRGKDLFATLSPRKRKAEPGKKQDNQTAKKIRENHKKCKEIVKKYL